MKLRASTEPFYCETKGVLINSLAVPESIGFQNALTPLEASTAEGTQCAHENNEGKEGSHSHSYDYSQSEGLWENMEERHWYGVNVRSPDETEADMDTVQGGSVIQLMQEKKSRDTLFWTTVVLHHVIYTECTKR